MRSLTTSCFPRGPTSWAVLADAPGLQKPASGSNNNMSCFPRGTTSWGVFTDTSGLQKPALRLNDDMRCFCGKVTALLSCFFFSFIEHNALPRQGYISLLIGLTDTTSRFTGANGHRDGLVMNFSRLRSGPRHAVFAAHTVHKNKS